MKTPIKAVFSVLQRSSVADLARALLRGRTPDRYDPKWQILDAVTDAIRSWHLPPGDYLEFGVYRGRSLIHAYRLARRKALSMGFYAFDSFQGLPATKDNAAADARFQEGEYACDEQELRRIMLRAGIQPSEITTIPGFFDTSLTPELKERLPITRAAIVWIDCDLYESTVPALDFVESYLTPGTFMIFDDWYSYAGDPTAGEIRATREWLGRRQDISLVEYRRFGTSGNSFIVQGAPPA